MRYVIPLIFTQACLSLILPCQGSLIEFDRSKVDPERKIVADIQKCNARPRQREYRDRPSSLVAIYISKTRAKT